MRTVYINGEYLPEDQAKVSVFDRGFLMADGVYEVTSVVAGKLLDFEGHLKRLQRSLNALDMAMPLTREEFLAIHRRLLELNQLQEGLIYLQVTRGNPKDRDFAFPDPSTPNTVVLFTQSKELLGSAIDTYGLKIISIPDLRWGRRDIKTVQLLYPSMGKMQAKAAGCDDAWMVDNQGYVTEGTASNAYIIKDRTLITRDLSHSILAGITRAALLGFADKMGLAIQERPFTVAEAQDADEAFVTAATSFALGVVEIDGIKIGTGEVGLITAQLRQIYIQESLKHAL